MCRSDADHDMQTIPVSPEALAEIRRVLDQYTTTPPQALILLAVAAQGLMTLNGVHFFESRAPDGQGMQIIHLPAGSGTSPRKHRLH